MRAPLCLAIDASTRPSPGQPKKLRDAGISIVLGYLGAETHPHWRKTLRREDVDAYHAAGVGVGVIWEAAPTDAAYFTPSQGRIDADHATTDARALGAPTGLRIFDTLDYDAKLTDMAAIRGYTAAFDALAEERGYDSRTYGDVAVLDALREPGDWQTYGWSHGRVSSCATIYQFRNGATVAGMPCDLDAVYDTAGLWLPRGWTPATWPAWAPKPGGDAVSGTVNVLTTVEARRLQQLLVGLGADIVVDGKCGPATKAALATANVPQADPDAARNAKIANLARQFVAAATD